MPKTAALAVAASRGFGEFTSGLLLTTETFTSNVTWTAPSYVSSLAVFTGRGSNATSDDYSSDTSYVNTYNTYKSVNGGGIVTTHDWSAIYNNLQSWISYMNSGSGRGGPVSRGPMASFEIYNTNNYGSYAGPVAPPATPGFAEQYFQYGTAADASSFSVPSSGTITYANTTQNGAVSVRFNPVYLGGDGTASTGIGKTFPGGTYNFSTGIGGAAPTTTFTNVAVTPSSSYSIVVPSGGSVSLSYYAPV